MVYANAITAANLINAVSCSFGWRIKTRKTDFVANISQTTVNAAQWGNSKNLFPIAKGSRLVWTLKANNCLTIPTSNKKIFAYISTRCSNLPQGYNEAVFTNWLHLSLKKPKHLDEV